MLLCIAGKNTIAVEVLEYALKQFTNLPIVGIPVKNDPGKDGFQRSFQKALWENQICQVRLEEIYDCEGLVFLSLEFDQIIVPDRFQTEGLFNLHFSLLPKYRGMYTSALPIIHHESQTGVTLHYIDRGIDTGDIIAQKVFPIDEEDTARDLYSKYIHYGTQLVKEHMEDIVRCSVLPAVPQDYKKATYYSKRSIDYKNLSVDLNQCAISIYDQIRAFNFREYQIPKVHNIPIATSEITDIRSQKRPGTVEVIDDYRLKLSTIDFDMVLYVDKFEQLMRAIEIGDAAYIQKLPKLGRYLKDVDASGRMPIDKAKASGNIAMISCLTH